MTQSAAMRVTESLGAAVLLFLTASTGNAQTNGQVWTNLTWDWLSTERLTYELDVEPKSQMVAAPGEPQWVNLDVTPSVAYAGLAYYAQWKITADHFGIPPIHTSNTIVNTLSAVTAPGGTSLSEHRVFGVGPDVSVPIATRSLLIALINVRYFWETGAEVKTEGQSLVLTSTFAVPSLKVK